MNAAWDLATAIYSTPGTREPFLKSPPYPQNPAFAAAVRPLPCHRVHRRRCVDATGQPHVWDSVVETVRPVERQKPREHGQPRLVDPWRVRRCNFDHGFAAVIGDGYPCVPARFRQSSLRSPSAPTRVAASHLPNLSPRNQAPISPGKFAHFAVGEGITGGLGVFSHRGDGYNFLERLDSSRGILHSLLAIVLVHAGGPIVVDLDRDHVQDLPGQAHPKRRLDAELI
ncbi:hypothetical protein PG999_003506 [Apiospora kogelbergensis]|uniref:Uncharacterized protein n=1 Tax=Apiospora kogelbergensis TaxID=1337665 RepID=A0AAW0R3P1_9PEZI